jgi:hypothetical protein
MAAPFTVFPDTTTETRGDIARSIEGFPSGTHRNADASGSAAHSASASCG